MSQKRKAPKDTYQLFTCLLFLVILSFLLTFWHQVVQPAQLSLGEEKVKELSDKDQC